MEVVSPSCNADERTLVAEKLLLEFCHEHKLHRLAVKLKSGKLRCVNPDDRSEIDQFFSPSLISKLGSAAQVRSLLRY